MFYIIIIQFFRWLFFCLNMEKMNYKIILAGTGTSHGIPVIGCNCKVCRSRNPHDKRFRCSAFLLDEKTSIVIDTGPEFRIQALKYKLKKLDAVLLTHSHADHLHGLDDVRIFSKDTFLNIYSNKETLNDVYSRFSYVFMKTQEGGGKPQLSLNEVEKYNLENPLRIGNFEIIPVPMSHGELPVCGWRIGNIAYLTDLSSLPESSYKLLKGIKYLIIDALRRTSHPTHLSFDEALEICARTTATDIYFTHICHSEKHNSINKYLRMKTKEMSLRDKKIKTAFDGLCLTGESKIIL